MYLDFYELREFPFSTGSDEKFFYESATHAEALANMLYAIGQRKGMVLITGEIGAGKTLLGSMLISRLGERSEAVVVRHPPDSGKQLLRALAEAMELKVSIDDDKLALVKLLEKHLTKMHHRGRLVAAILDEAQDLPDDAMEQVRFLWNLECDGQRLLQVVLIGQPQLRDRLRQPRWDSLQQRIVLSYHLGRLGPLDTAKYVMHRRRVAAYNGSPLRFTIRALEAIYEATKGIPRLINILCDSALLTAYARSSHKVTSGIVAEVLRDMTCWSLNVAPTTEEDTSDGK